MNLKMMLINYQVPQEIAEYYVNITEEFKEDFTVQPDKLRRYISLQLFKHRPYYRNEWFKSMKSSVAKCIGLGEDEYVRGRDSVGVNESGVGIAPHRDDLWDAVIHIEDIEGIPERQEIYDIFNSEISKGITLHHKDSSLVQMRCNFFILDPRGGQDPWMEDQILHLPKGWGVGFDAAYIHGTTPGKNKHITLSMGFLLKKETFDRLIKNNQYEWQRISKNTQFNVDMWKEGHNQLKFLNN